MLKIDFIKLIFEHLLPNLLLFFISENSMNSLNVKEDAKSSETGIEVWTFEEEPVKLNYTRMWEAREYAETKDEELINKDSRVISYLRKVKETPLKYPRKYNIIKKNPL